MRNIDTRFVIGLLLILGGGLLLLQTLDILQGTAANVFWLIVVGAGGALFTYYFIANPSQWWAAIPGITLLGLTVVNLLRLFAPQAENIYGGAIFLGGIGLSFIIVYLVSRSNWWAVIPGGVLITLGLVDLLDELSLSGFDTGGIFFLGLGFTFLLLAVLPTPEGRMTWALYPALPLLLLGAFVGLGGNQLWNYLWPGLVILAGVYFLVNALRRT